MKSLLEESVTSIDESAAARTPPDSPFVLMVDDQPARLLTYEAVLSGMPIQCVRAHSGAEALQLLLKHSFALILLDVNMPDMDGFEVARHVRSHSRLSKTPSFSLPASGCTISIASRATRWAPSITSACPSCRRSCAARSRCSSSSTIAAPSSSSSRRAAARAKPVPTAEAGATCDRSCARCSINRPTSSSSCAASAMPTAASRSGDTWMRTPPRCAFYGRTRDEVVGRTVLETFPERAARAEMLCQRALLGGERPQYETEYGGRQLFVRAFAVDDRSVALICTDITDRKRAEHALANSERRFQALLEGCPVGVAQNGMDGRFQYVNAGFCNIVGYTAEELSQLTWQQITHPDDLDADLGMAKQVLAGALPHYNMEKRYIRKDGTPVWVSMFGNFIFDEQRLPLQGVAVVVDISARKLAADAALDSRERLRSRTTPPASVPSTGRSAPMSSPGTRALASSGATGPTRRSICTPASAGIHPDDREMVKHQIEVSRPAHSPRLSGYLPRDQRRGWPDPLDRSARPGEVRKDRPVRMVGILRDISERVEAEQSLRASEERFRELANNIDQIVWTTDAQGQPNWYNDRWYEVIDVPLEQMINQGWHKLVHPAHADRIVKGFSAAVAAGETWEETFPVLAKDGAYRWFLVRALPIKAPDGTVLRWFGTNTDITAQRQLQDALTDADRRKDEFLAMLAHELRNPVAPIVSVAQILARKLSDDAQASELVSIVQRQVGHLARLLDDLLDVARITRGRIELRREVLNINDCIAVASETVEPLLRNGKHRLDFSRAPEELRVEVDRVRLTQCITNLLNNATKYSEPGSKIRVRTYARNDKAVIEVRDEGRGISPEVLPKIFELFAQDQRSLDRKSGGLGIGLSVCKKLIEMHGGTVSAQSDGIGKGSTFTLTLPRVPTGTGGEQLDSPKPGASSRRVLIVDDNADAADSISLLLQISGHKTTVVYDGESAITACAESAPDVILLDIGLPGLDGYQVIQKLRADGFTGRAIALSGYGQPEDTRRAMASGFDAHLVKPVELDELERAERPLSRVRARDQAVAGAMF